MNKKAAGFLVLFLLSGNIFAWQEVFSFYRNKLTVDFLDVGQGDAIFVETPQHHQVLIDGGPDSTILSKLQQLMPAEDKTIDIVVLSHPEKDHFFGLLDVLQRYKADYILWTGVKRDTPEYEQWQEVLLAQKKQGAKIITVQAGRQIKMGNVYFNIFSPADNLQGKEYKDSNDTSIVAKLVLGASDFLFTGDISAKAEKALNPRDLSADVLKISHHGSKYSSSELFLQAAAPEIAVVSAGKDNSYGHPAPETLQRLNKFGIQVLRTDLYGDIKMLSAGNNIIVE